MSGIVNVRSPLDNNNTQGRSHVYVQKLSNASPRKFDPTALPIRPTIIDIDTAMALWNEMEILFLGLFQCYSNNVSRLSIKLTLISSEIAQLSMS